ncbi:MAG: hypothetical protein ACTSSJ_03990 [Candidatus Odinarchaeia archaeon]
MKEEDIAHCIDAYFRKSGAQFQRQKIGPDIVFEDGSAIEVKGSEPESPWPDVGGILGQLAEYYF